MRRKKSAVWLCLPLLLFVSGARGATKKPAPEPKLSVSVRPGKTALWVGDILPYTIRVIHDRDVEFALDPLKRENLALAPFIVRAVSVERRKWSPNKRLLEITLQLATYEIGRSDLTVPPVHLYYFIREPGVAGKETQAETVRVPPTRVGLRSTLIGGQLRPRDDKPASPVDFARAATFLLLGLVGLAFVGVRGALWAWKIGHTSKAQRRTLPRHARDRLAQESLARIRAIGSDTDAELACFYREVSGFLRRYLDQSLDLEASCLTPQEIERALKLAGTNGALAQQIRDLLERCETVKYSRDGLRPARERHAESLEALERIAADMRRELAG